ncbi:hypothetical protein LSTR_LSTR015372 [Laodelphax striatellus]|uniref:Uncharacterized protein n=1 Tax=Laodelphax striatellus TaxID=195883 RepID=A0A482WN95_LAOST|nr:hypothetical protein LSTR_LSTR015372 [Laodelphax striatellus]
MYFSELKDDCRGLRILQLAKEAEKEDVYDSNNASPVLEELKPVAQISSCSEDVLFAPCTDDVGIIYSDLDPVNVRTCYDNSSDFIEVPSTS